MKESKEILLKKVEKLLEEGYSKDEILKTVNIQDLPKELAKEILTKVDESIIKNQLVKQTNDFSKGKMISGVFILILGLTMTGVSFIMGTTKFVVTIGFLLFGSYLIYEGYAESRRKDEDFKMRQSKIKKNKFNKY